MIDNQNNLILTNAFKQANPFSEAASLLGGASPLGEANLLGGASLLGGMQGMNSMQGGMNPAQGISPNTALLAELNGDMAGGNPVQEAPNYETLKKPILADIERANNFYEGKIEPMLRERHQFYEADVDYYNSRFPKTAQTDFVSYDFWSLVQWAIPSIMNSFFGGDEAVVIVGRGPEDVHKAEIMKGLIQYQIMTQNKGFLTFWDWFSDAMQYNLGAVKVYWKRRMEWGEEMLQSVPYDRLMLMQQDPNTYKITSVTPPNEFGMCDVTYSTMRLAENRPVIEPIRITELRWSPEAKSLSDANFVAQRMTVSADHLRRQVKAGVYDAAVIERVIERGQNERINEGSFEMELTDSEFDSKYRDEDKARHLYELYECYAKLDINGDGLLEDALITVVGNEIVRVVENPYGRVPFFTVSPVRDPFKVMGSLSLAEIVGELQSTKVALIRQVLINTSNVNNIRFFIEDSKVNADDIKKNRQFIKTRGDPRSVAVPFPQGTLAPWTMTLFEFIEGMMEQWTGRTRYNQGMDAKSMNKTATGINLLQQASAQRIDYIVRCFAETGVGELMRFLVELNQKYIDQPQVIRLKNEFLEISPDDLKGEFDIDVNTEAGVGRKSQTIQNLQLYLSQIAPTGMQVGVVRPGEWSKGAQKLLSESGIRDPQSYVVDPEIAQQEYYQNMFQQLMGHLNQLSQSAQQGDPQAQMQLAQESQTLQMILAAGQQMQSQQMQGQQMQAAQGGQPQPIARPQGVTGPQMPSMSDPTARALQAGQTRMANIQNGA